MISSVSPRLDDEFRLSIASTFFITDMYMRQLAPLLVSLILIPSIPLAAQDKLPLAIDFAIPGVTYDAAIPTPDQILGHTIGERHTRPHEVAAYLKEVAEASDRVVFGEYGRTYEQRPLVYVVITSRENHAKLEQIRQANLLLSDEPESVSDEDLQSMPVVTQLHYNVHGNEASGAEAALVVLYHLAAGRGEAVESILNDGVVVLDPLINPDGRDRFVDWVNGNRGAVATADAQDREHDEPWPGGRTNHYWFDLNRDWLPAQHPESQGRLELFHHWRPQVLIDVHEMGYESTFFFQPGVPGRTNPNTPENTRRLTEELGEYHAAMLDRIGSLYYSRARFDDFYYGKGSTYPDVNGAIGILFEQAGSRGLKRTTRDGIITYAYTIRNQVATSLSTLNGAIGMRLKFLSNQRKFYASAADEGPEEDVEAYVIDYSEARTRAQLFAQMLRRHRIRIHELARTVSEGGTNVAPGQAWIVPAKQRQARLLKSMMEEVTTFEDSLFYDVSSWTIPLAFGIDVHALSGDPSDYFGVEVSEIPLDGGVFEGSDDAYAYLMPWDRFYAPRALTRFFEAGLRVRVATQPFTISVGGQSMSFDRGTIVLPVISRDQDDRTTPEMLENLLEKTVKNDHVRIYTVETGYTPTGDDLGRTAQLEAPRVAILAGEGTSSYAVGQIWHLLSERMHMPVSLVDARSISDLNLDAYNTIIMPPGSYDEENGSLRHIRRWVSDGGTLVALESAVRTVVNQGWLDETLRDAPGDSVDVPYADVGAALGARRLAGAILETVLDTTHPLAYGMEKRIPVFRKTDLYLEPSNTPGVTVAVYEDDALLSGYAHRTRRAAFSGTAGILAADEGRGNVILMLDDPAFRAFFLGSSRLLSNAVVFGRTF